MAVIPQFQESQAPATTSELAIQGANAGQSWMNQAQERNIQQIQSQIQQAAAQRQAQIFQYNLPALIAKGQADQLSEQNNAQSALLQQQLRGQWQTLKPQVIQDLGQIEDPSNQPTEPDGTPDWNAKYQAYEKLQAKYGSLSLLPEGKAYYDMIEQAKQNAFNMSVQHNMAQMTLNRLQLANQLGTDKGITLQNNAAAVAAGSKPAIAQTEAQNQMRNKALTDISAQRDNLSQMGYSISKMSQDIQAEQNSSLGSGPIAGSSIMSMVRPSVQQVQSDIGDFANRIMATVKNIRNVNEFNAVTASIPRATDQASVQNEKLQKLQEITQVLNERNELKDKLLRENPTMDPDQAGQQADAAIPFPASVLNNSSVAGAPSRSAGTSNTPPKFQAGQVYKDAKGNTATFKGGDPSDPANWSQ